MSKKVLLSGIKPTGNLHVANYFGAMKQFVDLQDEYDTYISIVNYHAMTTVHNGELLKKLTFEAVVDHLAIGLDPEKATLFVQSDIEGLTELTWIFNTLITVPYLERAHAYKDKIAKGIEPSVALFDYPVLMASDILAMNPDVIPVGEDQRQHIEIAREIARKFNNQYGEIFGEPKEMIMENVAVVPGIDGEKMSKSYGNTIPLFATDEEIRSQVAKIVTDSTPVGEAVDVEKDNVFALHKLFSADILDELKNRYEKGDIGHKESKDILAENIIKFVTPFRNKREELMNNPDYVHEVLEKGAEKANKKVKEVLEKVREVTGIKYK